MTDDFDFGFSSVSEESIIQISGANDYKDRLEKMHRAIIPLLNNLAKDAKINPYIHWPDREEKIGQFKQKLQDIKDGK